MKHELLLDITRHMPCKTIDINGQPPSRDWRALPEKGRSVA